MKVLLAVEHTKDAAAQLQFITNSRWPEHTDFAVLNVVTPGLLWDYNLFAVNETDDYIEEQARAAERLVDATVAQLRAQYPDATVEGLVAHGSPIREILAAAAEVKANSIVVGSKYKRGLEHLPSASISQAVVDQMPDSVTAVYVVRAEGTWDRQPQRRQNIADLKAG